MIIETGTSETQVRSFRKKRREGTGREGDRKNLNKR
jgi:hypothetical protein